MKAALCLFIEMARIYRFVYHAQCVFPKSWNPLFNVLVARDHLISLDPVSTPCSTLRTAVEQDRLKTIQRRGVARFFRLTRFKLIPD